MYEKQSVGSLLDAIKEAGFTKLLFLGIALLFWILGYHDLFIASLTLFIYVNANTIWKFILKGVDLKWLNLKNFLP